MGDLGIFSTRLKEIRTNLDMTQKDFGEYVGLTQATLSAYEKGGKNPSLENVKAIAEKCEVSIDWLCGLDTSRFNQNKPKDSKDLAIQIIELVQSNNNIKLMQIDDPDDILYGSSISEHPMCWAIKLDVNWNLAQVLETYTALSKLLESGGIKQEVLDTWKIGALEELKGVPLDVLPFN